MKQKPSKRRSVRRKVCETAVELVVSLDDLSEALRARFDDMPLGAELIVRVPGGADWSNTDLVIGTDTELTVRWTTRGLEETEDSSDLVRKPCGCWLYTDVDCLLHPKRSR